MEILEVAMNKTFVMFSLILSLCGSSVAYGNTYNVDPKESSIHWLGEKKIGDSHHGTISVKSGELVWKNGALASGKVVVDMKSIENEDLSGGSKQKLEGHLKSPDFFDVEKHGTASFKIKSVKKLADGMLEVVGDLTIKGVTEPNSFQAKVEEKKGALILSGTLVFNRAKHGVKYASASFFDLKKMGDKVIKDEIKIDVNLIAKK
jgi:polyisoprenoid-binding protein YceI